MTETLNIHKQGIDVIEHVKICDLFLGEDSTRKVK